MGDNICDLGHYMFAAGCRFEKGNQFTNFIDIVASKNR
jgi:hypothetical protein